jgi:hypothetical protein
MLTRTIRKLTTQELKAIRAKQEAIQFDWKHLLGRLFGWFMFLGLFCVSLWGLGILRVPYQAIALFVTIYLPVGIWSIHEAINEFKQKKKSWDWLIERNQVESESIQIGKYYLLTDDMEDEHYYACEQEEGGLYFFGGSNKTRYHEGQFPTERVEMVWARNDTSTEGFYEVFTQGQYVAPLRVMDGDGFLKIYLKYADDIEGDIVDGNLEMIDRLVDS